MNSPDLPPASRLGSTLIYFFGLVLVAASVLGAFVAATGRNRAEAQEVVSRKAEVARGPKVRVAHVAQATGTRVVTLPGEVHAWAQTTIYAKVAGYLQAISVDKGDSVQSGQVIGRIQSPEIDQTVANAAADLTLKQVTARREHDLLKQKLAAQADVDTADAQLGQSEATLRSARAMQSYEFLKAPFGGVVTNRYVDLGALLPAATSSTQGTQPIVDIADSRTLRIYAYLGQDDAAQSKLGDVVKITMEQRPTLTVEGKVGRVAHALDTRSRTMLVEIDIDNRKTGINPGEFVHVEMTLRASAYPSVPAEALIYRGTNLLVATITDGVAHLVPVKAGRDDGKTIQITSGLTGGETVALNAQTDVDEGTTVQPVEDAPTK